MWVSLHHGTGSWVPVCPKQLWHCRSPAEPPIAGPGLQVLNPSLLLVVLVEQRLQPLVPVGKCETVLGDDLNTSKPLQLGTVAVGGGQVDNAEAWQVFPPVNVGLLLVGAAVSCMPRPWPWQLQYNFPRVRGAFIFPVN